MTFDGLPAYRDMSAQWFAFMGIDRDTPSTYRTATDFAKAPADEAWVYSCVRRLSQAAQGTPLKVYVKAGKELIPATDEPSPEGDDLQYLLDYANPVDMTGADLKAYTTASMTVWGECFYRKVRGRLGGSPQELYWLRAPDVDVKSGNGRMVNAYEHQVAGSAKEVYQPRDVIHFKRPNLQNPSRGLSPLSSIGSQISTNKAWADRTNAFVYNDSIPPGYWQIPKDAEFAKQDENLVRRTLRALRGPRQKGKVPVMPAGLEFKGISLTPQASEMLATGKVSRMAICAATGVPLVLAGDDDKNTVYGNLREAERLFWRGTVIPDLDAYADTLNNWLVPDFDPTRRRLVVAFDYSEIEALRPAWDVEWNAWLAGIYSQAVVPNEFRRHFRLGKDVPWGDRPIPRTAVAIRPDPASLDASSLPALEPNLDAGLAPIEGATGEQYGDSTAVPDSLRAWGKSLYRHPAVKAWVAEPYVPLDTDALFAGRSIPTDTRLAIEAGLRRRDSAAAIAARIEVPA